MTSGQHAGPHAPLKGKTDDIWHSSEADASQNIETYDPREVPEYEMKFKQAVTAEDVFLGVSITLTCIIVTIKFVYCAGSSKCFLSSCFIRFCQLLNFSIISSCRGEFILLALRFVTIKRYDDFGD